MNRFVRFILFSLGVTAVALGQAVPGRYIVEFQRAPAASVAAQARVRFSPADQAVAAQRDQIRADHALAEPSIRALGGQVRARYDTVFNGLAVEIGEEGAARLRQMPNVREVYPDMRQELYLDHAVNVHRIRDAWQSIAGTQAGAGAGIKIGIIDSGIDIAHPGFKGFTAEVPQGFPIVSSERERVNTNSKVIVARDYVGLGALDTLGHGTGVAMTAAGMTVDVGVAGFAPFSGAAPGAWLGNYRTMDDNGQSMSSTFLLALQDAVNDGMNIVNYSAGGPLTDSGRESGGPEARAINSALAAGVLVVVAAGNSGPEPGTIGFPGVLESAITAGANFNERVLDDAVVLADLSPFPMLRAPSLADLDTQVSGPMTDVAMIDQNGFGCSPFAPGSLAGQVALISRSIVGSPDACTFDSKINNAQAGGAVGVVVYNSDPAGGLVGMQLATATLPSTFVTNASGLEMKRYVGANPGAAALLDFSGSTPLPFPSDAIPAFTSGGPTPGGGLKPDLMAVGSWLLTASTTQGNPNLPYVLTSGTSFSAPLITGAGAVLMSARPGLTAEQYRSLLVNTPPVLAWPTGETVEPQIAGAGKLDLARALQSTAAAAPSAVSFRASSSTVEVTRTLVVTNLGAETDTFSVVPKSLTEGPTPAIDTTSFSLAKGASQTLQLQMTGSDLAPGEYTGFLEITGTKSAVPVRVPYWLGVQGTAAKYIALQQPVDRRTFSFGDVVQFVFRTLDAAGLPVAVGDPEVTTTAPRASVDSVAPAGTVPGTYRATVRVGRRPESGTNVFTISAGGVTRDVTFFVRAN
jgi:hypothetical protein